ncbi:DNA alkylation repair enzyme [Anatilimnocola aggregata]|uniref:DNA alkylation repair enzyme n=1 Tax=Anatilimnocola aggregata TaxID=2528021 RepID=A0A517YCJ2_9BACT|nr:DNA alkylation repair protein [Anatilimnocola aggregata]QDU27842.1 DNA alkylation repair enzyme [Anatilimnocola aggregata]
MKKKAVPKSPPKKSSPKKPAVTKGVGAKRTESAAAIVEELRKLGSQSTKNTLMKHGAREPFFGTKIQDMKPIQKRIKKDYQLALDLYATGISDAMYLAGLIADEMQMTKADLETWLKGAYWYMLSEYTVPWVAAEGPHGWALALKWIESKDEKTAAAGWTTLSNLIAVKPDDELDFAAFLKLLQRVQKTIHQQPNRVRAAMNMFVISCGGYSQPLTEKAQAIAKAIGIVEVDMGDTSCKTPFAPEYIAKMHARGTLGKKKKTCRC